MPEVSNDVVARRKEPSYFGKGGGGPLGRHLDCQGASALSKGRKRPVRQAGGVHKVRDSIATKRQGWNG